MSTDRVLSVFAIVGIGVPMLLLTFDYAVFGVLSLVHLVARRVHHG
jgi:hypothetical protein